MNAAAGVLSRGHLVVVRFGGRGQQVALVLGSPRDNGRVPVMKWRANSRRWTTRVFVTAAEVLGAADGNDLHAAGLDAAAIRAAGVARALGGAR